VRWIAVVVLALSVCVSASAQSGAAEPAQRRPLTQPAKAPVPGKLVGNWQGTLETGQGDGLRIVVKIAGDDGRYHGALYSIDQGGDAIAMTSVSLKGGDVAFAITVIGLTYKGTLNPDGNSISGSSTQGKETHALNLKRVSEEETWAIPGPVKPMAKDAQPDFEVVTVKPSKPNTPGKSIDFDGRRVTAQNFNMDDLISFAYGLHSRQIIGAPGWFDSELFDIDGIPDVPGEPSEKQTGVLLQKLLVERFGLKFHHEQRELSVFAITVAKGGPKMTVSAPGQENDDDFSFARLGNLTVGNMTMADFAQWMQRSVTDRPIVDQTGLTEHYDFKLKWTPDDSQFAQFRSTGAVPRKREGANAPPPLDVAMRQQIGLDIKPVKAMVDVIVIDHMEQPSAN
jgi:uncharacterized protein (TIGR03435 family)